MPRSQAVLITGATRGIGREAALHLARRGHTVLATGRNPELLDTLRREAAASHLPLLASPLDVTDEKAIAATVALALREFGRLDALVNNAGFGMAGAYEELDPAEVRAIFETNFFAPLRLAQAVLPNMRAQRFGTIVNVGSIAGLVAVPMEGAYSATKFALRAMSRSMRMELAPFGVRVVLIEPGVVRTGFHLNKATAAQAIQADTPYVQFRRETEIRARARAIFGGQADRTARRIREVIEARWPAARYTVGLDAFAGAAAVRLLPDRLFDVVLRRAIMGRWT
jgi:NAD(P)-dependent dehydrogenase (short-subunit alcohol dehydrogenase family)